MIAVMIMAQIPLWAETGTVRVTRQCQVLFLDKPDAALDKAYLFDGMHSHEISLFGKRLSNDVDLPIGPLTLYFSVSPVAKAEELAKEAPHVKLSEEITDFYLLLRATPENAESQYSLEIVDASNGKLKLGETLWINSTNHNVSAEVGDDSFLIPPNGQVVSPPPLKESGYYPVHFTFQREGTGEYRTVLKRTWRYMANSRNLGFIRETGGRRPEIFTIRDLRD